MVFFLTNSTQNFSVFFIFSVTYLFCYFSIASNFPLVLSEKHIPKICLEFVQYLLMNLHLFSAFAQHLLILGTEFPQRFLSIFLSNKEGALLSYW